MSAAGWGPSKLAPKYSRNAARRDAVTACVVWFLAVAWVLMLTKGVPGYQFDGVAALHTGMNVAGGDGLVSKVARLGDPELALQPGITKAPLFPALLGGLIALGMSAEFAGWAVTITAWSATAALLFLLARLVLPVLHSLLVVTLYLTHVTSLRWGISIHEQSLFVMLTTATLWRLTLLDTNRSAQDWRQYATLGVLAALALLTSYQGAPLLFFVTIGAWLIARRVGRYALFWAFAAAVALMGAWPLFRFVSVIAKGVRPGFATNDGSSYYAILAGIISAFQNDVFGRLLVWLYDGSAMDVIIVVAATAALVSALVFVARRQSQWRVLAGFAIAYLAILVFTLGSGGVEKYEPRVGTSIYGVLFIFAVYLFWLLGSHCKAGIARKGIKALGLVALGAFVVVQVDRYPDLLKGHGPMCAIPDTVAWVRANIPKGSVIVSQHCGFQIQATSQDYFWMPIPPAARYGSTEKWGEADFLKACQTTPTPWVIVFHAVRDGGLPIDALQAQPGYGPFVERLIAGEATAKVVTAVQTKEAFIYRVDCAGQ